jgi:hypothetical protein
MSAGTDMYSWQMVVGLRSSERKLAEREGFERLLPLEAKSLN